MDNFHLGTVQKTTLAMKMQTLSVPLFSSRGQSHWQAIATTFKNVGQENRKLYKIPSMAGS
jgi:hypothetical protein